MVIALNSKYYGKTDDQGNTVIYRTNGKPVSRPYSFIVNNRFYTITPSRIIVRVGVGEKWSMTLLPEDVLIAVPVFDGITRETKSEYKFWLDETHITIELSKYKDQFINNPKSMKYFIDKKMIIKSYFEGKQR